MARSVRAARGCLLDPADIPRFGQLGVIAAMQGIHCTSHAPFVILRLGETRAEAGAYVWRSLLDSARWWAMEPTRRWKK